MYQSEINLGDAQQKVDCHLMPCRVDGDTNQQVRAKEYFYPTIMPLQEKDNSEDRLNNQVLLASFRGRPLQGTHVPVPDGFNGYALKRNGIKNPPTCRSFQKFTYWNWDQLPTKDDAVVKALGWINVAGAIHKPIE